MHQVPQRRSSRSMSRTRASDEAKEINGNGYENHYDESSTLPAASSSVPSRASSTSKRQLNSIAEQHTSPAQSASRTSSRTNTNSNGNGNGTHQQLQIPSSSRTQAPPVPVSPADCPDSTNGVRPIYRRDGGSKYYWCDGEPSLEKVAAHLDTLTSDDLALRASTSTLRTNVTQLQSTVESLLDMNARLKRELRMQKLNSNRRWFYAILMLFCFTYGQQLVRSIVDTFVWALTQPQEFFPALLANISTLSTWLWLLIFPLTLLLFIHSVLNEYGAGRFTLIRTVSYLIAGLTMQLPLLYFLMQVGLVQLSNLRQSPYFTVQWANHVVTIGICAFMVIVDCALIAMHRNLN